MPRQKQRVAEPAEKAGGSGAEDQGREALAARVHIVDDDPVIRGLLEVVVEAGGWRAEVHESAESFLAVVRADGPGCVLLDMRMPGMNGLDCLREIKRREIHLPVIMVTGHGDVALAVQAMKDGALDFLEKPIVVARVMEVVRLALERSLAAYGSRQSRVGRERRLAKLTPRERQVMERVILGEINKLVGRRLGIGEKTVEVHRARVMRKLGAQSLADLIRIARGEEPENIGSAGAGADVPALPAKRSAGEG